MTDQFITQESMRIQQLLQTAPLQLPDSETSLLDVQILLAHALSVKKSYLYTHPEKKLSSKALELFQALLARRQQGEPIAYILQQKDFWSLSLQVTPATLIPRPETELLVECALQLADQQQSLKLLDLGTGSGAIALAIASERPTWHIDASDSSPEALAVAKANAQRLGLSAINFIHSHWFNQITQQYDMIISNPPYIFADDPCWSAQALHFEPRTALIAANKGYAAYDIIIPAAFTHLQPGGTLLLEHGATQHAQLETQLLAAGFENITSRRDYANKPRVLSGTTHL